MNPFLIAGLVALVIVMTIVMTIIAMKWAAGQKTPAAIARVEAELVEDGWKLIQRTVAAVADDTAKKQALANATDALAEHYAGVRKLKAAVAALPEA